MNSIYSAYIYIKAFFAGEKDSVSDATPLLHYQINNQIHHDTLQCDIVFTTCSEGTNTFFTVLKGDSNTQVVIQF